MRNILTGLIVLFLLITSCSSRDNKSDNMTEKFTWNAQLAGYDFKRYDEKGETNFEYFISEFDKFPWIEQLENYQKIQQGCSPTLSVEDHKTGTNFWVSMSGDKNDNGYVIGYVYPKTVKGFLGLGKPKGKRWVEIYLTKDKKLVKKCFEMFFNRESGSLVSTIKKLELYDEMEAQN